MRTGHRQLILLGGGGFLMEDSPLLDRYILSSSAVDYPRICFLPTASGDSDATLWNFYRAYAHYPCRASHLSLFRPKSAQIADFLLNQDVIFVGGGNTRSMLALWREWEVDIALYRAYHAGVLISGVSAGMICWFEKGLTDSNYGELRPISGLGWLKGGACPHYDGEPERRPALRAHVASGAMPSSWAADDSAALHFVNEELHAVVASREGANAWRVEPDKYSFRERVIAARYLGLNEH